MRFDYGRSGPDLEALLLVLEATVGSRVRLGEPTASAARHGEYRFILSSGVSVYVQPPICPSGRLRVGRQWRFKRHRDPDWTYKATISDVVEAICRMHDTSGRRRV